MSLISTLKRALGFTEPDEEELDSPTPTGYVNPFARYSHEEVEADDRQTAPGEVERLNAALTKVSAERDAARQAQLSAERQKRSLSDRIYDLERQLTTLESEKEKLFDENRRLEVQIKSQPGRMPAIAPGDTAAQALKKALESERDAATMLKRDLEAIKMKAKLSDALVSELQSKASSATREAQEARRDRDAALADRERLKKQLEEAHQELEEAALAIKQIGRVEEFKKKSDMRIAELQRSVALKDKEIRSLNSTIEHNLRRHAEVQELMRREIAILRGDETAPGERLEEKPEEKKRRRHSAPEPPRDDNQLTLF